MDINQNQHGKKTRCRKSNTNGITKVISAYVIDCPEHITVLDLSNKNIHTLEENMNLPPNLVDLNISHNQLTEVPKCLQNLEHLKNLEMSYNALQYFDDSPKFCHTIEKLNLSHNNLNGPPYWVWTQAPRKLMDIDLSFNVNLTKSLEKEYFEELLGYTTQLINIKINNCCLTHHMKLLSTFPKASVLELGSSCLSLFSVNRMTEVPCEEFEKIVHIEKLNLSNVQLYTIKTDIDILSNLVEINLSHNQISNLPSEFCKIKNLEICVLSFNHLLYLPDEIGNLENLSCLQIDNNELCMLPETIVELKNLRILDLYDNSLYEIPNLIGQVTEIDLAQNYFEEPTELDYLEKRYKLRLCLPERCNGKKIEVERPESERSYEDTDDEAYEELLLNSHSEKDPQPSHEPPSSPEDWDSDDYWVPRYRKHITSTSHNPWLYYVERKMAEGNFCPMDIHAISIAEKVKYEKLCKPQVMYESDGQFDDYSDDNS
ncbi:unnamed protein product [Chilo suppressalis]|uniref:Uncharacterized protein n=1 Tax=Chilo suppressalis TaxID=168631 RepID=A0ABN8AUL9_CHISP|nr:unnamed protein product [Chilo suppressalis]